MVASSCNTVQINTGLGLQLGYAWPSMFIYRRSQDASHGDMLGLKVAKALVVASSCNTVHINTGLGFN